MSSEYRRQARGSASDRDPVPALIAFQAVTLRIGGSRVLEGITWRVAREEQWVVLGPNGAGKSTLLAALAGRVPVVAGRIFRSGAMGRQGAVGYLSFDLARRILQQDADRDEARYFSGDSGPRTPVRSFFLSGGRGGHGALTVTGRLAQLEIGHLMDREIRALSTGEMRKVLIARALVGKPDLLILDEPFDGLDSAAREDLAAMIEVLMRSGLTVILATNRLEEIPPGASHLLGLKDGRVMFSGRRADLLKAALIDRLYGAAAMVPGRGQASGSALPAMRGGGGRQSLVEMRKVTVRYGPLTVVEKLDWVIRRGENWGLVGPNGSGKSTLVSMISGDHLQAYANDISLFGRRRGSGESIWEIKEKIGLVSFALQVGYRADISALSVVVSGFYSSIGLYRVADLQRRRTALGRMASLGIEHLAPKPFVHLSQGQQRMVLLARAMVKQPLLLLLDEPCQGLDPVNRRMVFDVVEAIGRQGRTQILLVTHFEDELPGCIRHILRLGGGLAVVEARGRQTDKDIRSER